MIDPPKLAGLVDLGFHRTLEQLGIVEYDYVQSTHDGKLTVINAQIKGGLKVQITIKIS